MHVNDDLRHIFNTAELVELHVRVHLATGVPVHDAFLKQRWIEPHNDAAGHLRFAALLIDYHATVLHGHDLLDADDSRLGVDLDLGNLYATDALIG